MFLSWKTTQSLDLSLPVLQRMTLLPSLLEITSQGPISLKINIFLVGNLCNCDYCRVCNSIYAYLWDLCLLYYHLWFKKKIIEELIWSSFVHFRGNLVLDVKCCFWLNFISYYNWIFLVFVILKMYWFSYWQQLNM